ncbi:VOC family protein [Roseisalinus antarcticus]|uniref:Glyoxalase/Bleomycin resistance protein/Dioxygenase superfamily protein n=1 Tax=Roseisalinus antarcticus TaxID=254357 RepID=A0A1Y5RDG9_9RHOB|nr:VOC family protein [Roseisalinus antarcticus]SLN14051.1 Glyoxalase/Bleomycin resistance protein/Dioxygenase superfamily protein [Roseisalinus antarcticus]
MARLEHVNVTVTDPDATAALLCDLFGWTVRWSGGAIHDGRSVHVGDEGSYVVVYAAPGGADRTAGDTYRTQGGLNHIGVVVDDLDRVEALVRDKGYSPHSHADYEPGRRFYFREENGVEIEVVSYA